MCRFPCTRGRALILALTTFFVSSAAAADLSGQWLMTAEKNTYAIHAWAEVCGPRPRDSNKSRKRKVKITEQGKKIAFAVGRRWRFGTHGCLSENPALRFVRYDEGSKTTVCATPKGYAQQEQGKYKLKVVDRNTLRYRGKTEYDWALKGQPCKATFKQSYTFKRDPPLPEEVVEKPPPEPAAPTKPEEAPPAKAEKTKKTPPRMVQPPPPGPERSAAPAYQLHQREERGGAGSAGGLTAETSQIGSGSLRVGAKAAQWILLLSLAFALLGGLFLALRKR